jgi:hypothetical protein
MKINASTTNTSDFYIKKHISTYVGDFIQLFMGVSVNWWSFWEDFLEALEMMSFF